MDIRKRVIHVYLLNQISWAYSNGKNKYELLQSKPGINMKCDQKGCITYVKYSQVINGAAHIIFCNSTGKELKNIDVTKLAKRYLNIVYLNKVGVYSLATNDKANPELLVATPRLNVELSHQKNKEAYIMLNENSKRLRKSKGLSQEELAIKLNVVRQTVSKWENGLSVPDSGMLILLADELDTSVSTLLGESVSEATSDDIKTISEKLEVINLQLASQLQEQYCMALNSYL